MSDEIIEVRAVDQATLDGLRAWGWVSYILHLIVALAVVIPGAQVSVGGTVQLRAPAGRHAGAMTMRTVRDIPIAANAMTRFNPISYHLLITGAGTMHDGKDIMLRLTFANAGTVTVLAMVTNPQSGGSSYFLN